jgi:hypothetical protein
MERRIQSRLSYFFDWFILVFEQTFGPDNSHCQKPASIFVRITCLPSQIVLAEDDSSRPVHGLLCFLPPHSHVCTNFAYNESAFSLGRAGPLLRSRVIGSLRKEMLVGNPTTVH